jgi:hypothetical protein
MIGFTKALRGDKDGRGEWDTDQVIDKRREQVLPKIAHKICSALRSSHPHSNRPWPESNCLDVPVRNLTYCSTKTVAVLCDALNRTRPDRWTKKLIEQVSLNRDTFHGANENQCPAKGI